MIENPDAFLSAIPVETSEAHNLKSEILSDIEYLSGDVDMLGDHLKKKRGTPLDYTTLKVLRNGLKLYKYILENKKLSFEDMAKYSDRVAKIDMSIIGLSDSVNFNFPDTATATPETATEEKQGENDNESITNQLRGRVQEILHSTTETASDTMSLALVGVILAAIVIDHKPTAAYAQQELEPDHTHEHRPDTEPGNPIETILASAQATLESKRPVTKETFTPTTKEEVFAAMRMRASPGNFSDFPVKNLQMKRSGYMTGFGQPVYLFNAKTDTKLEGLSILDPELTDQKANELGITQVTFNKRGELLRIVNAAGIEITLEGIPITPDIYTAGLTD